MTAAAIALKVLEVVPLGPLAVAALQGWLGRNPAATPEQIAAKVASYHAAAAGRQDAVDDFNASLTDGRA